MKHVTTIGLRWICVPTPFVVRHSYSKLRTRNSEQICTNEVNGEGLNMHVVHRAEVVKITEQKRRDGSSKVLQRHNAHVATSDVRAMRDDEYGESIHEGA